VIRARRPGRGSTAAPAAVAVAVAIAALLATCATAPAPTGSAASASAVPASPGRSSAAPSSSSAAPPSTLVAIDDELLGLLPEAVAGHTLDVSREAAAESASDPTLATTADRIAVAIAVDPTTQSFVVASVVKLKPGVFGDEFFRDWRDSFDEGVCAQAGGVSGNAQATMDGRTVYIGTCAGGAHTYHVHLEGPDAIVSLNAVGDARLGEQLMDSLPD
jgi:hypothetical protein